MLAAGLLDQRTARGFDEKREVLLAQTLQIIEIRTDIRYAPNAVAEDFRCTGGILHGKPRTAREGGPG